MNKKRFKKITISLLALAMVLGTVAMAAEGVYKKEVTATYGRIKFEHEGKDVTEQIASKYDTPAFIMEDRAYVPVRAIADLLDVDVDYDHRTHMAKLSDTKVEEYEKRLEEKDDEIRRLKKENERCEEMDFTRSELEDVEDDLNDRYYEYGRVNLDINLRGDRSDITIDIDIDLSSVREEDNWIRMNRREKEYLIEDIVDDVRDEFSESDITGSIYDSYYREELYTFSQREDGRLKISENDDVRRY